jgi:hypothetical protein
MRLEIPILVLSGTGRPGASSQFPPIWADIWADSPPGTRRSTVAACLILGGGRGVVGILRQLPVGAGPRRRRANDHPRCPTASRAGLPDVGVPGRPLARRAPRTVPRPTPPVDLRPPGPSPRKRHRVPQVVLKVPAQILRPAASIGHAIRGFARFAGASGSSPSS